MCPKQHLGYLTFANWVWQLHNMFNWPIEAQRAKLLTITFFLLSKRKYSFYEWFQFHMSSIKILPCDSCCYDPHKQTSSLEKALSESHTESQFITFYILYTCRSYTQKPPTGYFNRCAVLDKKLSQLIQGSTRAELWTSCLNSCALKLCRGKTNSSSPVFVETNSPNTQAEKTPQKNTPSIITKGNLDQMEVDLDEELALHKALHQPSRTEQGLWWPWHGEGQSWWTRQPHKSHLCLSWGKPSFIFPWYCIERMNRDQLKRKHTKHITGC